MNFEEANDIISRRYGYHMATIPTDEEVEEAEKAFGICYEIKCHKCKRHDECFMEGIERFNCNFFTEDKHGKH